MSGTDAQSPTSRVKHPRRALPDPNIVWEERKALVKREVEAERAASEAKTAKLRTLRLAKEAEERSTPPLDLPAAPALPLKHMRNGR